MRACGTALQGTRLKDKADHARIPHSSSRAALLRLPAESLPVKDGLRRSAAIPAMESGGDGEKVRKNVRDVGGWGVGGGGGWWVGRREGERGNGIVSD